MNELASFTRHGGMLDVARRLFPDAPQPWIDLSTGINPVAYPVGDLAPACWERLPDELGHHAVETAAAARYGVTPKAEVVAGPGSQAFIQLLPALCEGGDVRILGRTYSEFERVFRGAGRQVRVAPRLEALAGADVAIVVNPNNPDGRHVPVPDLAALTRSVGALVVDEAFADALPPSHSLVPCLPLPGTIVLRSFGKMYGLAGLRLGFAILAPERARQLRRRLGPWAVSGPALAIGAAALADEAWLAAARSHLAEDGARLMFLLRQVGAEPVGGTPLFRLVAHRAAPALFRTLARAGILTRPLDGEPTWLRFGYPGTDVGWRRLEAALKTFR